ncbi:MAG: N-acetylmuramoyl-L-alanine amidase [Bacteroidales bacterium]|nr:N-acetylmuramoyl-L-alanine amidase [Bacteroidales bacterium]
MERGKKQKVVVLLDNGHGENTKGKCSPMLPDGRRLYEWEWARREVKRIAEKLKAEGIEYRILVPEMADTRLEDRCSRANSIHKEVTASGGTTIFLSIHCNAAGSEGKWMTAHGWEAYTTRGATKADAFAECLYESAKKHFAKGTAIRKDTTDGDQDKEANFYVLKHTNMPAVLTENFFMDNMEECKWLLSEEGVETCAVMHVEGIKDYIKNNVK